MRFGITGNTRKENIWTPIGEIVEHFVATGRSYCIQERVATGLAERNAIDTKHIQSNTCESLVSEVDVVLSFGGDGTLLNTAHEIGSAGVPILGVNLGRLGFMTLVEVAALRDAVERLESGQFEIEDRLALAVTAPDLENMDVRWAVNEFTVQRSGEVGLLSIDVHVDDKHLNTFWADGLIIATPTGSTAYSLALGGPIMTPGCGSILITPIAPHTLTVRPIVIPDSSTIKIRVLDDDKEYVFTADGNSSILGGNHAGITIQKAGFSVKLIRFDDQEYFHMLRTKLMWGVRKS